MVSGELQAYRITDLQCTLHCAMTLGLRLRTRAERSCSGTSVTIQYCCRGVDKANRKARNLNSKQSAAYRYLMEWFIWALWDDRGGKKVAREGMSWACPNEMCIRVTIYSIHWAYICLAKKQGSLVRRSAPKVLHSASISPNPTLGRQPYCSGSLRPRTRCRERIGGT